MDPLNSSIRILIEIVGRVERSDHLTLNEEQLSVLKGVMLDIENAKFKSLSTDSEKKLKILNNSIEKEDTKINKVLAKIISSVDKTKKNEELNKIKGALITLCQKIESGKVPFTPPKKPKNLTVFNPQIRQHIFNVLKKIYNCPKDAPFPVILLDELYGAVNSYLTQQRKLKQKRYDYELGTQIEIIKTLLIEKELKGIAPEESMKQIERFEGLSL